MHNPSPYPDPTINVLQINHTNTCDCYLNLVFSPTHPSLVQPFCLLLRASHAWTSIVTVPAQLNLFSCRLLQPFPPESRLYKLSNPSLRFSSIHSLAASFSSSLNRILPVYISLLLLLLKMVSKHQISILTFALLVSTSLAALVPEQPLVLKYHNGPLLKGTLTVNLIWYGKFTPTQRSIIVDFINSLSSSNKALAPSTSAWWQTTEKYKGGGASTLVVGSQILNEDYSLGKSLKDASLLALASRFNQVNSINVVLTASDVAVGGFCGRCGTHSSASFGSTKVAYIWVGNSQTQCPGQCAWPFHQPIYGPQTPPLVAPNGDVGIDGMIINLATLLAGTVTNPFNNGYFQGPATAPLEAVSACTGMFGPGSYPGFPGSVRSDKVSGASYNANGVNGRKFLLPAMWDPTMSTCKTTV